MTRLVLIDTANFFHRSFYAFPMQLTTPAGAFINAVYGFASMLIALTEELAPTHLMVAFESEKEPVFREIEFPDYKATRVKAPDELYAQIPRVKEIATAFNIPIFELAGFEADDLIGTTVEKFQNHPDLKIIILTGDLDTLQMVKNDKVVVETLKKGVSETIIYNEETTKERYGVEPDQLPDYKGLVGDPSDNIPGVPGIGPKTATIIIQKYGKLENFLEAGGEEKSYQKISEFKEQAYLSRDLSKIRRDAPLINLQLADLEYPGLPKNSVISYFNKLGFKSLINRINSC